MKPVVKYGVYTDILLRVPVYVTKCRLFEENTENHKFCQIAARRSVWITSCIQIRPNLRTQPSLTMHVIKELQSIAA